MKFNFNKITNYLLSAFIFSMLFSILFSWIFLPYKGIADNRVKIYSTKEINIKKVTELLSYSPIKGTQTVHFFVVSRWTMILINPLNGFKAQGFNIPVINFVFANENANIDTPRTLEGLIAHETTHTDIIDKFGFKTMISPHWKIEGVCDYVSKETSIYSKDIPLVLDKYRKNQHLNGREDYLIFKLQVQTLIDQGKTINEIISNDIEEPKL